jgi:hypothetical protein
MAVKAESVPRKTRVPGPHKSMISTLGLYRAEMLPDVSANTAFDIVPGESTASQRLENSYVTNCETLRDSQRPLHRPSGPLYRNESRYMTRKFRCSTKCSLVGTQRNTLRGLLVDCRRVKEVSKKG